MIKIGLLSSRCHTYESDELDCNILFSLFVAVPSSPPSLHRPNIVVLSSEPSETKNNTLMFLVKTLDGFPPGVGE
jgi:hypothetical protein